MDQPIETEEDFRRTLAYLLRNMCVLIVDSADLLDADTNQRVKSMSRQADALFTYLSPEP